MRTWTCMTEPGWRVKRPAKPIPHSCSCFSCVKSGRLAGRLRPEPRIEPSGFEPNGIESVVSMACPGIRLCRLEEIPDGDSRGFDPLGVGRDTLLVVRQGTSLYAWRDACP